MSVFDSVREVCVKAKLALTKQRRDECFQIIDVFRKNNPRITVAGDHVFPFYYVVVTYKESMPDLCLCESDTAGFKLQYLLEQREDVVEVSWPSRVGIHLTDPNVMASFFKDVKPPNR